MVAVVCFALGLQENFLSKFDLLLALSMVEVKAASLVPILLVAFEVRNSAIELRSCVLDLSFKLLNLDCK